MQMGFMLGILAFAGLDSTIGMCADDGSGNLFGFWCFVVKGGGLAVLGAVLGGVVGAVVSASRPYDG